MPSFSRTSQAWYAHPALFRKSDHEALYGHEEIGLAGEVEGEVFIRWESLGGREVPQLQVFDDGWALLASVPEVIQMLGRLSDHTPTPDQVIAGLKELGFTDETKREPPADKYALVRSRIEHYEAEQQAKVAQAELLASADKSRPAPRSRRAH